VKIEADVEIIGEMYDELSDYLEDLIIRYNAKPDRRIRINSLKTNK
jgi:hypothetical protein